MEFKEPFLLAMRERDPKLFQALSRSGRLDQFLQQKSLEAHQLLKEIMEQEPKDDPQAERLAQERVFAIMLDFPVPESEQNPEMKDMPRTRTSVAPTTASPRAASPKSARRV